MATSKFGPPSNWIGDALHPGDAPHPGRSRPPEPHNLPPPKSRPTTPPGPSSAMQPDQANLDEQPIVPIVPPAAQANCAAAIVTWLETKPWRSPDTWSLLFHHNGGAAPSSAPHVPPPQTSAIASSPTAKASSDLPPPPPPPLPPPPLPRPEQHHGWGQQPQSHPQPECASAMGAKQHHQPTWPVPCAGAPGCEQKPQSHPQPGGSEQHRQPAYSVPCAGAPGGEQQPQSHADAQGTTPRAGAPGGGQQPQSRSSATGNQQQHHHQQASSADSRPGAAASSSSTESAAEQQLRQQQCLMQQMQQRLEKAISFFTMGLEVLRRMQMKTVKTDTKKSSRALDSSVQVALNPLTEFVNIKETLPRDALFQGQGLQRAPVKTPSTGPRGHMAKLSSRAHGAQPRSILLRTSVFLKVREK